MIIGIRVRQVKLDIRDYDRRFGTIFGDENLELGIQIEDCQLESLMSDRIGYYNDLDEDQGF